MRLFRSALLVWACCLASASGDIFTNGNSTASPGLKVIWAVPKEVWPRDAIWTYKVVPQEFSETVISNAMAIGGFTIKDKVKLSAEALAIEKRALVFKNKDETKWLEILPTLGYMEYYDQNAEAKAVSAVKDVPEPVVGVPNLAEATKLGLKYIRLLGLDVSQIARKPGTCEFDLRWEITSREWTDQKTKKTVREIQSFGIDFTRCIDGIEMSGFPDVFVNFGNNAKVQELEVSWRNLRPYELLRNIITEKELVEALQAKKIRLPPIEGIPNEQIQSITITNAAPRYSRSGKPADEPLDYFRPVLQLDAIVSDGKTNAYTWFQTAISGGNK